MNRSGLLRQAHHALHLALYACHAWRLARISLAFDVGRKCSKAIFPAESVNFSAAASPLALHSKRWPDGCRSERISSQGGGGRQRGGDPRSHERRRQRERNERRECGLAHAPKAVLYVPRNSGMSGWPSGLWKYRPSPASALRQDASGHSRLPAPRSAHFPGSELRPSVPTQAGTTPLMLAASKGHLEAIQALLSNGADTNAACPEVRTTVAGPATPLRA